MFVFPPNSADLKLIEDPEIQENNRQITRRLSELLKKFPEYTIHVEGHANNLSWQDPEKAVEEEKELLILSLGRAEAVKEMLVIEGISATRLIPVGRGGSDPIVPFGDGEHRWKNRRVEFILVR